MSKGKATRSSTATSSTPAPIPSISNDILTGRFTENEWNSLVEVEDGEEFVFGLLSEIVGGVMDVIHERHIDEQTIPFTLDWAEDVMIKLINWQFLTHDVGEIGGGDTWVPDDEPARVAVDSWGRGSVPCRVLEALPEPVEEAAEEEEAPDTSLSESSGDEVIEDSFDVFRKNPDLLTLNKLKSELRRYSIPKDDILTLSKLDKPDEPLQLLYQALCVIQYGHSDSYTYRKSVNNLPETKQFVEKFGPRPISDDTMARLKEYVDNIKLHPDHISKVSCKAALSLCEWLHKAYTHQLLCNTMNIDSTIEYRVLRNSIIEIKSSQNPPVCTKEVMSAVFALITGKLNSDFRTCKRFFSNPSLLDWIENFECDALSNGFIKAFKSKYLGRSVEQLKTASLSASIMYKWCEDQIYGYGSIIVKPPDRKTKGKNRKAVRVKTVTVEQVPDQVDTPRSSLNNMLPHQSAAIVKAQQGRPPGQKEVEYDEYGNVISVVKVDPRRLPSHKVKTTYEIVDSNSVSKRHFSKTLKPIKTRPSVSKQSTSFLLDTPDHTPLPPSFVEAVQASPGVVIKQGSRIKRGPEGSYLSPMNSAIQASQLLYSN